MSTNSVVVKEEAANASLVKADSAQSIGIEIYIKSEVEADEPNVSIKQEADDTRTETPCAAFNVDEKYPFHVDVKTEPLDYLPDDYGLPSGGYIVDQPHTSYSDSSYGKRKTDLFNRNGTNGKYNCPVCGKGFASTSNVQRHLLLHSRTKINCKFCNRQYSNAEQLDKHVQNKHGEDRKYQCPDCEKIFKSSSNLLQHSRVHLKVKPFHCEKCLRTFSVKSNLLRHQSKTRCKKPMDRPLICHVCHKEFRREFLLKSHLRRHDTEKPFFCDHCQMNFKYKSTLIRHIQIHNGLKPFACTVCNKTFTHSGLIKPHMRTHTGEKPYKCTFCSKYFAHKHNMQRHAIRHTIIKNLVCEVCNKKFPKESRLRYHMKIHVDQKHFSCTVCPKKFSHRQNILRHYNRKHPGATYDSTETDASVASKVWEAVAQKKLVLKGYESPEEILGCV